MAKDKEVKSNGFKKYIVLLWIGVSLPVLFIASIFIYIVFFAELPSLQELENPKSNLASEIISSDQKSLGRYYIENRTNIRFESLSPYLVNGLVATEDARFYTHSGVDLRALARSIKGVIVGNDNAGGGSTITQQLAKMLFPREKLSKPQVVLRKLKEWVIAIRLERNYTKDEIIAMYLNKFDFVNNAVGIKSAAHIYFNTSPDSLKIEQAAMLVGMAKNPALFNPHNPRRVDTTLQRRNVVLGQMMKYKYITKQAFDSLKKLPMKLNFQSDDHNQGSATYFREYLRDYLKEYFKTNKKPDGTSYDLYKDGLKIYTTLDSRMQIYAEQAVTEWIGGDLQPKFFKHWKNVKNAPFYRMTQKEIDNLMTSSMKRSERYRILKKAGKSMEEIITNFNTPTEMTIFKWTGEVDTVMTPMDSMRYYKHFIQTGFMSMDPHTGFIKAWVGGINYKHFKYDHVRQGKRQVGSTFKPFVYTLAMQEGWSPCYQVPNIPVTFDLPEGGTWSPHNSDGKYGGMLTLKKGLALSINTVTAYVMKQFGAQAVVDLARKMGITSHMDAVPSICLGTPDISVYEMVGANSTFANQGVWTEPVFITHIEDRNGNVIAEFTPKRVEALSEETAYMTVNLMKGVVQGGTGVRLSYRFGLKNPIAGKTGTTQNNSDGWFMGITPDLVSGVWVGCEDRSVHFRTTSQGQGAEMALPIWAMYMKKVYADKKLKISQGDFEKPENFDNIKVEFDCTKYDKFDEEEEHIEFGDDE